MKTGVFSFFSPIFAVALAAIFAVSLPDTAAAEWQLVTDTTDPMSDSQRQAAASEFTKPTRNLEFPFNSIKAAAVVDCRAGNLEMSIVFNQRAQLNASKKPESAGEHYYWVKIRIDKGARNMTTFDGPLRPTTITLNESDTKRILGDVRTGNVMHVQVPLGKKSEFGISARLAHPDNFDLFFGISKVIFSFDLKGAAAAIDKIAAVC